jgi:hypothetical protein
MFGADDLFLNAYHILIQKMTIQIKSESKLLILNS